VRSGCSGWRGRPRAWGVGETLRLGAEPVQAGDREEAVLIRQVSLMVAPPPRPLFGEGLPVDVVSGHLNLPH
jgi:hypothetical protein